MCIEQVSDSATVIKRAYGRLTQSLRLSQKFGQLLGGYVGPFELPKHVHQLTGSGPKGGLEPAGGLARFNLGGSFGQSVLRKMRWYFYGYAETTMKQVLQS